ncbi:hypothetical protein BBJ28_00012417 [Nothophytophthora sp. Chile5]|nr:hypothetical protein BBJ28_00012417 [Nothophytophthora sp. Chile5]
MQQAIAEQRQLNEELAQCSFRPQLATRRPTRAPASSNSKPIRNCRCCQREQPVMHQLAPGSGGRAPVLPSCRYQRSITDEAVASDALERLASLCAVLRERSREELQVSGRSEQRHLPSGRSEELQKTLPPVHKPNASIHSIRPPRPSTLRHASMPFDALVAALQVQERRMRGLTKCA